MKSPIKTAMAVRLPNGEIEVEEIKETHLKDKWKIFGLPLLRGVAGLIESFKTGYKALMTSAEKSGFADQEGQELSKEKESAIMAAVTAIGGVLGIVLAVVLFMYIPSLLFELTDKYLTSGFMTQNNLKPLFEGVIKMAVFVLYVASVSLMKDIKRVFMYHGAEHKTIFCFESGEELTVENVRKFKRFHPRCGTSFIFLMLAVSILLTSALTLVLPDFVIHTQYIWVPIKILLVPIMCGIGYEVLRFCGKHDNLFTKIVSAPGLWIQRLTTKEPDDSMIEIAIASVKAVLPENEADVECK